MAGRKYGIDTDEFDRATRDAFDDILHTGEAKEWNYKELKRKYDNLKVVTLKNFPNLWPGLEFTLSVKTVLNIKDNTLPFVGILLGPASSMKTLIIELFRDYDLTLYTDYFSPKSLVSHNSSLPEEALRKVDLLPRIRNKLFLTPELSPLFGSKEDELNQVIHILIRVADGHGYASDSGAKGHRGYAGDMMFTWIGAAVEIPYKVHKLLGNLGPKLYFFRLPRIEESEDEYFSKRRDNFKLMRDAIKKALYEYLQYFDMNPAIVIEQEDEITRLTWSNGGNGKGNTTSTTKIEDDQLPPKIQMHDDLNDENAERIIIRLALMLAHLRAIVPTWETYGSQGSEYAYAIPKIEDPSRAMTQLRNLARARALSKGRLSVTMNDIPMLIQTVMSTASVERVRIFELLLANSGVLNTTQICTFLDVSKPTALRTMTELKVSGLVDIPYEPGYNIEKQIKLKPKFEWFLSEEFACLKDARLLSSTCKEKYPPRAEDNEGQNKELHQDSDLDTGQDNDERGGEISLHPPNKEIERSNPDSDPNPELAKTSEYLKNLQEAEQARKNKEGPKK